MVSEAQLAAAEMRGLQEDPSAAVSLGVVPSARRSLRLPELMLEIRETLPQIRLFYREGESLALATQLRTGELDLALLNLTFVPPDHGLETALIADEGPVVLVAPDHPLADKASCRLESLQDELFIMVKRDASFVNTAFTRAAQEVGFTPRIAVHSENLSMGRELVGAGLGLMISHPWVAEGPGAPVVAVPLDAPMLRFHFVLAHQREARQRPAVAGFLSYALEALQKAGRPRDLKA
jgi:DNA-binding transcriptional LysR family regulator